MTEPNRKRRIRNRKKARRTRPSAGDMVVLTGLPPGFLDDLPAEDQRAIREVIGGTIVLNEYDELGRAELEFKDKEGTIHFIYVKPDFLKKVD